CAQGAIARASCVKISGAFGNRQRGRDLKDLFLAAGCPQLGCGHVLSSIMRRERSDRIAPAEIKAARRPPGAARRAHKPSPVLPSARRCPKPPPLPRKTGLRSSAVSPIQLCARSVPPIGLAPRAPRAPPHQFLRAQRSR